jgi:hypothetical protein
MNFVHKKLSSYIKYVNDQREPMRRHSFLESVKKYIALQNDDPSSVRLRDKEYVKDLQTVDIKKRDYRALKVPKKFFTRKRFEEVFKCTPESRNLTEVTEVFKGETVKGFVVPILADGEYDLEDVEETGTEMNTRVEDGAAVLVEDQARRKFTVLQDKTRASKKDEETPFTASELLGLIGLTPEVTPEGESGIAGNAKAGSDEDSSDDEDDDASEDFALDALIRRPKAKASNAVAVAAKAAPKAKAVAGKKQSAASVQRAPTTPLRVDKPSVALRSGAGEPPGEAPMPQCPDSDKRRGRPPMSEEAKEGKRLADVREKATELLAQLEAADGQLKAAEDTSIAFGNIAYDESDQESVKALAAHLKTHMGLINAAKGKLLPFAKKCDLLEEAQTDRCTIAASGIKIRMKKLDAALRLCKVSVNKTGEKPLDITEAIKGCELMGVSIPLACQILSFDREVSYALSCKQYDDLAKSFVEERLAKLQSAGDAIERVALWRIESLMMKLCREVTTVDLEKGAGMSYERVTDCMEVGGRGSSAGIAKVQYGPSLSVHRKCVLCGCYVGVTF